MSILTRFTGNVPRVIGRPWAGGVDRDVWNWMRKTHDAGSILSSQLTQIFNSPGGALQGLLTTLGDLLTHDGTNPARLPVGDPLAVLAADPTAALGLAYHTQLAKLMQRCVASWRMEEGVGERYDVIGRDGFQDLTPYDNTLVQAAGKLGYAVESPGGTGLYRLDPGGAGPLNPRLGNFTISAWVYPTSFATPIYIVMKNAGSSMPYAVGYNFTISVAAGVGKLFAVLGSAAGAGGIRGGQYATNATMTLNEWQHCVMVVDRTNTGRFYVYRNNVLARPATAVDSDAVDHWGDTSGDIKTDAPFGVLLRTIDVTACGCSGLHGPPTDWGAARIDGLHYFDDALTPSDVALLYSAGRGLELKPLWSERDDEALAYAMM